MRRSTEDSEGAVNIPTGAPSKDHGKAHEGGSEAVVSGECDARQYAPVVAGVEAPSRGRVRGVRAGDLTMSKRTKAGRRASFRGYVSDPMGHDSALAWWNGMTQEERTGHLQRGGFLRVVVVTVPQ